MKNIYIVSVSSFYVFFILELYSGLASLMGASLGTYFITRYLRTDSMPWVNFVFLMLYLSYHHIREQFFSVYDPHVVDITGALMVMVMKLSSFGWSVHDGRNSKDLLTSYTKSRIIKKHPNLLPYLGYAFFYASLLTGPAFDYADYDRFIHNTLFEDVPESRRPGKRKRRIPRSGRAALKKTLQGFFWAFLFTQAPKFVTLEYVFQPEFVQQHGFIYRIFYLWVLYVSYRLKYYTIWLIAEGACILCGIGYNGYDSQTDSFKWDRVQNIDPWAFETGQNVHTCLEAWNMNTNKWLKHFIYMRLAKKGKKPGFKSTLATFATSAFWHGTRPGYYMTFIMGAFLQTVGKIFRRNFRPIFVDKDGNKSKAKPLYDVTCYFVTQLAFSFVTQPFAILEFSKSWHCWSTVNYYVIIGTALTFLVFRGPWSHQVTKFLSKYHMSAPKPIHRDSQFNKTESEKVARALNSYISRDRDLVDSPTLGVPSLDYLESFEGKDIDEELKELVETWYKFKETKGDLGLKVAYNNFVAEIQRIVSDTRAQASEVIDSKKQQ
ncbi:Lysophospholipid acyltransferase [Yamadazyma tenuis]|nr:Lysophospholipid acyltransferase [Yamadazyma tenuis]